mmetsp:Transcript_74255/g.210237  ORF Transcript_74255/g.210237 Transcript_74255/m.210237 type:complete len:401 (+) Transcript_74255:249-1451(+)
MVAGTATSAAGSAKPSRASSKSKTATKRSRKTPPRIHSSAAGSSSTGTGADPPPPPRIPPMPGSCNRRACCGCPCFGLVHSSSLLTTFPPWIISVSRHTEPSGIRRSVCLTSWTPAPPGNPPSMRTGIPPPTPPLDLPSAPPSRWPRMLANPPPPMTPALAAAMRFSWIWRRQASVPSGNVPAFEKSSVTCSTNSRSPRLTLSGRSPSSFAISQSHATRPPMLGSCAQCFSKDSCGSSDCMSAAYCEGGAKRTWLDPVSTRKRAGLGLSLMTAMPPDTIQKLRSPSNCGFPGMSMVSASTHTRVSGLYAFSGSSPTDMYDVPSPEGTMANTAFWPCSCSIWYSGFWTCASLRHPRPHMPSHSRRGGRAASSTMMKDWFFTVAAPNCSVSCTWNPATAPLP